MDLQIIQISRILAMNLLLIIMAIQDVKIMRINLWIFLIFALWGIHGGIHLFPIFVFCIIAIFNIFSKFLINKIAWADIIAITLCIANLPIFYIGPFLILLGLSSSLFGLYKRNIINSKIKRSKIISSQELPLIPFISFAYLVVSILLYIM